jgi:hypothetical protein
MIQHIFWIRWISILFTYFHPLFIHAAEHCIGLCKYFISFVYAVLCKKKYDKVCPFENAVSFTLTLRLLMSYIYMEHLFLMFLDHTQRRTTVGRTPLDERSAHRRDLYLTTHDTHNRQISMSLVGVEPTISAVERPQAAHLLRSWVRIPPEAWIFVCCECRVLSGRGLCDELIARPEESYRLWCVVVCDLETSGICTPYIYDIRILRVNYLTLILLTWRKWWANNASN